MKDNQAAREAILLSIRRNLLGQSHAQLASESRTIGDSLPSPARPEAHGKPKDAAAQRARCARFEEVLRGVDGQVHRARDEQAAARVLAKLVRDQKAQRIARSDAPLVRRLSDPLAGAAELYDGWRERARLLECDVGITGAQWGIAETGTLVLNEEVERSRLTSLVPPVHIALLHGRTILPDLGSAFSMATSSGRPPSTLTFITGPSRTADIELVLVVGVHGPRELHVILIEEPSP